MKPDPCVALVRWLDAQMEGHWLDKAPSVADDLTIYTVGFLLYEGKDRLILVQSLGDGHFGNVIHIPRGMVQSITKIELE
jgi:hypothetical protein